MIDIFAPSVSVIANGVEGKIILLYGSNNLGKTTQAVAFPKPYVMACECGLNGLSGVKYGVISNWADFRSAVKQFTSPATKKKARENYSTIIIDEVYASSIYCQDYICASHGDGALTLADGDTKHNLYQLYEKEYFRQVNALVNSGFTVVFIAHAQADSKTGFITPKGDKRCMNPIIDHCDYVVYLKSNGVDKDNKVIKSSAYLAETNEFFARSRIDHTPTYIEEFTAQNLQDVIQEGINAKAEKDNAVVVSFQEQKILNEVTPLDFDTLMNEFNTIIKTLADKENFESYWKPRITQITESFLGKDGKVNQCTREQVEIISLILSDLKDLINTESNS